MSRDYQKIYDIMKAELLLKKHNILHNNQKKNNDNEIKAEKLKPKPVKVGK